jgi:peptidoglycan/LPS O-acetylase OafA/YrhL
MMSPVSLLPPVLALLIAICMTYTMTRFMPTHINALKQSRFVSIDGLRGYLAFFVFIHHACVWYFYLHSGDWKIPPSKIYTHFGQTSVSFFFMITAFLFFLKLLESDNKKIDWTRLFISRIFCCICFICSG